MINHKRTGKIVIVGNPNTGKSSLFNRITGLKQQVGNYPGVTVDRKTGHLKIEGVKWEVEDLPGTYSYFPKSDEERVVYSRINEMLVPENRPDVLIYTADSTQLQRNLVFFTQLRDLGFNLVLVCTMVDLHKDRAMAISTLSQEFGVPVFEVNGRTGDGLETLIAYIHDLPAVIEHTQPFVLTDFQDITQSPAAQVVNTRLRYQKIQEILRQYESKRLVGDGLSYRIDNYVVHPILGYLVFMSILFVLFQFIFRFSSLPMEWIDEGFTQLSSFTRMNMPTGLFTQLLSEGLIPGLGGVITFIPQIAILFLFIQLLEDTGYMSRVVFIMDRLMRPFGLNGKSVVPLMSSVACAVPGIMSARTIPSGRDRLITILVAPLMSCSARIPVYTLLIAIVIPAKQLFGFIDLQGLVLFSLYALGLIAALILSFLFSRFLPENSRSFMVMELPRYRIPHLKQALLSMIEKVKMFIFDAGKIILALSVLLWALASFGPSDEMEVAVAQVHVPVTNQVDSIAVYNNQVTQLKLEHSYIGNIGKWIEPVIEPLGFDWKMGIAIVTSFAAREVFVGSMATIYSVGIDYNDERRLIERLRAEKESETGKMKYNLATGLSLMVFYVFAMQCLATFAVVKRETGTWKWPIVQVVYLGVLAYVFSFLVYHLFQ